MSVSWRNVGRAPPEKGEGGGLIVFLAESPPLPRLRWSESELNKWTMCGVFLVDFFRNVSGLHSKSFCLTKNNGYLEPWNINYLEDHPMTCKWVITRVNKSPKQGLWDPFQVAFLWLVNWGDPNHLRILGWSSKYRTWPEFEILWLVTYVTWCSPLDPQTRKGAPFELVWWAWKNIIQ